MREGIDDATGKVVFAEFSYDETTGCPHFVVFLRVSSLHGLSITHN